MYLHCPGSNKVTHSYFTHRTLHSTDGVSQSNREAALYKKRTVWARLRNGVAGSHPVRHMNIYIYTYIHTHIHIYTYIHTYIYRVPQEERTKLREGVPYVKLYRYNPKHLYPKLNGYGDNDKRSMKL